MNVDLVLAPVLSAAAALGTARMLVRQAESYKRSGIYRSVAPLSYDRAASCLASARSFAESIGTCCGSAPVRRVAEGAAYDECDSCGQNWLV